MTIARNRDEYYKEYYYAKKNRNEDWYVDKVNKAAENIKLNKKSDVRYQNLTRAEQRVCDLIVDGYSYKQTAIELKLSIRTVETHVEQIFKKYDVVGIGVVGLMKKLYNVNKYSTTYAPNGDIQRSFYLG